MPGVQTPSVLCRFLLAALWAAVLAACHVSAQTESKEAPGKLHKCNPGPWGSLDYYYIYLEAPDYVADRFVMPNALPKWIFVNGTEEGVRKLFQSARLSVALQEHLLDPKHVVKQGHLLTVFPPLPDLLALTPGQRTILYRELSKSELNDFYTTPVCIPGNDADQWAAHSRLRPKLREAFKSMTYMRGEALCFSDVSVLVSMAESDTEARDIYMTMTLTRSLVLRLNVKKTVNMRPVFAYWAGTNRHKEIASVIDSAEGTEGIDCLDCIHLLPSLPRRYLYSYPPTELALKGRMPDCHWTSLNFFNSTPQDYFLDTRLASMHVLEQYVTVDPPYVFGDVLMFMTPQGSAIHSCTYVADDIVFTKNGENVATPWLLMSINDVKQVYSHKGKTEVQAYRLKSLGKQSRK